METSTMRPRDRDPGPESSFYWYWLIVLHDSLLSNSVIIGQLTNPSKHANFATGTCFPKLKNFWISEKHRIVSSILHPKFKKQYHMKRKYSEKGLGKFENALRGILLFGNSRENCFIYRLKFPQNQTNIILGFKEKWSTVDQGSLAAQEFDVLANSSDLWSFLIIHFYT